MKILLFQPCAIGDNVVASLAAELFKKKYPECTFDFFTSTPRSVSLLETNPFINNVICSPDWNLYWDRNKDEPGPLYKQYDLCYSLYWWNAPMIQSFLEDLELPTDYTNVKVYTQDRHKEFAKKQWEGSKGYKICLQEDLGTTYYSGRAKWNAPKYYSELKEKLTKFGTVYEFGMYKNPDRLYIYDAAIMEQADMLICSHGSMEHVAAAVGCQTISMSTVFKPEDAMASFYQNKYMPKDRQHLIVRPKNWCNDFHRCITYNKNQFPHKLPPHNFPDRFPPHMYKDCDYGFGKSTCIAEITPNEIITHVEAAIEMRKDD